MGPICLYTKLVLPQSEKATGKFFYKFGFISSLAHNGLIPLTNGGIGLRCLVIIASD